MAALERSDVSVSGYPFTTTVWRGGEGRPVVYFHGAGGLNPKDPFLVRLADRFEVIAPLHPGFNELDEIKDLDDMRDLALYADDLLETLGLSAASVVGHSFGGMVAAELAAHVPTRVETLVVIAPVGLWRDEEPVVDLLGVRGPELASLRWFDPNGPAAVAASEAMADPDADPVEGMLAANRGLTAVMKYLWPIPDHGLSRRLRRIKARTLVFWGAEDRVVPASYAKHFGAGITGSRVAVFEQAGHLVTLEHLDRSVELVGGFLAGE